MDFFFNLKIPVNMLTCWKFFFVEPMLNVCIGDGNFRCSIIQSLLGINCMDAVCFYQIHYTVVSAVHESVDTKESFSTLFKWPHNSAALSTQTFFSNPAVIVSLNTKYYQI